MQKYNRLITGQIVKAKDGEGSPLPYMESREVRRSFRSKYAPHVGKKQLAKAAR